MVRKEYTLEEISFSQKEHRKVMEPTLNKWFTMPKILNFVEPKITYPFKFKNWLSVYSENKNKTTILILKHNQWIIGYVSIVIDNNKGTILHLFIDPNYRRQGFGSILLTEIENYSRESGVNTIQLRTQKKNKISLDFFIKLKYQENQKRKPKYIRMKKSLIIDS